MRSPARPVLAPLLATVLALACLLAVGGIAAPPHAQARGRDVPAGADDELSPDTDTDTDPDATPPGVRRLADLPYGRDARQRVDVYLPASTAGAAPRPVLFLVHGGGWRHGDKAMRQVVAHKVAHWTSRGWAVVSVDYRLLPDTPVSAQLQDVARALAFVQARAADWGADGRRVVLMGHSAGAHLVGWLAAGGRPPADVALRPWRGAVLLDSAVMDVPAVMRLPHLPLYDDAFDHDRAAWTALSPAAQLGRPQPPVLLVCSTRRRLSCPMAQAFARRAAGSGTRAEVRREDRSHAHINDDLGLPGPYTDAVDAFLASLR